jgi:hypothetical protein
MADIDFLRQYLAGRDLPCAMCEGGFSVEAAAIAIWLHQWKTIRPLPPL